MSDVSAYHVFVCALFPVQGGMWTGYSHTQYHANHLFLHIRHVDVEIEKFTWTFYTIMLLCFSSKTGDRSANTPFGVLFSYDVSTVSIQRGTRDEYSLHLSTVPFLLGTKLFSDDSLLNLELYTSWNLFGVCPAKPIYS